MIMPTLLVVDDERSVLSFVSKAMIRRGWSVVEVDNVHDGLAVARERAIDVALCDVVMPQSSGSEFARAIRSGTAAVPVVLMTGHPTAQLFAGDTLPDWWRPIPLLEKPFTLNELEAALAAALEEKLRAGETIASHTSLYSVARD
jgi:two-component system, NtrC family, nitrogen regulation response regulator GlnG